jgi:plastocyanin
MKNLKWVRGLLWVGIILLIVVPSVRAQDDDDAFEITIKDTSFRHEGENITNQIVVVPAGIMVNWMNEDPLITSSGLEGVTPHGVMIIDPEGKLIDKSPLLYQNTRTFSHKFDKPGVYTYQCFVHPSLMKGKFLVFKAQMASMQTEQHPAR